MNVGTRTKIERQIAKKVIDDAIAGGYLLSVFDGEEFAINRSKDPKAVLAAMFSTDEDWLVVYAVEDGDVVRVGAVQFVYGNDGYDVIADASSTPRIDAILIGASELAEKLERQYS